jgi:hypothetical protein
MAENSKDLRATNDLGVAPKAAGNRPTEQEAKKGHHSLEGDAPAQSSIYPRHPDGCSRPEVVQALGDCNQKEGEHPEM